MDIDIENNTQIYNILEEKVMPQLKIRGVEKEKVLYKVVSVEF